MTETHTHAVVETRQGDRRRLFRRLIGLNFALLLIVAVATILTNSPVIAQPGTGQPAGQARGRGDYTLVTGRYQGGTSNAVYILDAANQELLALSWNRSRDEFETIGFRRLSEDAKFNMGR